MTLVLLAVGLEGGPLRAQQAQEGHWEGHAVSPGGQLINVTFDISAVADSFQATTHGAIGDFPARSFYLDEERISFTWNPGFKIDCRLLRQLSRQYKGGCKDESGYIGPITIAPPGVEVTPEDLDPDMAFSVWNLSREAYEAIRYPGAVKREVEPVGKQVDVGGTRLYVVEQGQGDVTVVLEAGLGDGHEVWRQVQREVAAGARVIAYDRAGIGQSSPASTPRSPEQMARELHALLKAVGAPPPYVLVGHDAGGFTVRRFAALYPGYVAGLVLVDPAHEQQAARWSALDAESYADYIGRKKTFYGAMPGVLPAEFEAFTQILERGILAEGEVLPTVPTVLISALRPVATPRWVHETPAGQQARLALHRAWLETVKDGTHVVTTSSGSYVHEEEPELVISAIQRVSDAVRAKP